MKKRFFALLLAFAMVISMCPVTAFAATTSVASGTCGDAVTWDLTDDGVLTISGTGNMTNYNGGVKKYAPWDSYSGVITKVVIESGVTSIGASAFEASNAASYSEVSTAYPKLTSVTIPDTVTSIGEDAFMGCSALTSVTIPESVTSVGWSAFRNCDALTEVTINGTVVGTYMFGACANLKTIHFGEKVATLNDGAFSDCDALTSVTVPANITAATNAFSYCDGLQEVTVNCTQVYSQMFAYCPNLKTVNLADTVTKIGSYAFSGAGIESITIPASVTSIGNKAFQNCAALTTVNYTGTVEQWNAISISETENGALTSASITYNYGAHTCVFDQQNTDEQYLVSAADCENAATYYYSCTCGEAGIETFTSGEALGHSYVEGTCSACGEADPDYVAPVEPKQVDGVYQIGTVGELLWLAEQANAAKVTYDVVLTADIDLDNDPFPVIGKSTSKYFAGNFDGQGYTISGLNVSSDNVGRTSYLGLFAYITGKVENLTVMGTVTGEYTLGGISGGAGGGASFINCLSDVTVVGAARSNGQSSNGVGGICGFVGNNGVTFESCVNLGDITGYSTAGGILGYCNNNATTFTNCYNRGDITSAAPGSGAHPARAAGIVAAGASGTTTIAYTLSNCYSTGDILFSNASSSVGGKLTCSNAATVTNSYYTDESANEGKSAAKLGTEVSAEDLKGYAATLGDAYTADAEQINDGYPVLTWQAPAHTCDFNQAVVADKYLVSAAGCENAATYYYSCACGEAGTETFTSGEALGHKFVDGVCTVCGEAEVATYTVTLPEGEGYTVTAAEGSASPVAEGGSYSFTVEIADDYVAPNLTVKANDVELTAVNGAYTIENITEDQVITVEGVTGYPTFESIELYTSSSSYNNGEEPLEITPEFTGTTYTGYTVNVPDYLSSLYAVCTMSEETVNSEYADDYIMFSNNYGGASGSRASDGVAIRSVNFPNGYAQIWFDGAPDNRYQINVKRYTTLKALAIDGVMDSAFNRDDTSYHAYVDSTAAGVVITPTAYNTSYVISINGTNITSGTAYTLPYAWNEDGKMNVEIVVSYLGLTSSTYTVELEKMPLNDAPFIMTQPAEADYIVGDTTEALSVVASANGSMTYQWYSNTTDSNEGGTAIEDATASTYAPSAEAVGTLYYYCVVTNTDKTEGNVTVSETARVTIDPDPTPVAVITNPGSAMPDDGYTYGWNTGYVYQAGEEAEPLELEVSSAAEGGTWSYQWYRTSNRGYHITSYSTLSGATESTYTPDTSLTMANDGGYYYWCMVTYTFKGETYTVRSTTGETVTEGEGDAAKTYDVNAAYVFISVDEASTPEITKQPVSAEYVVGDTATNLSVSATKADGGKMTYQWYVNAENSTEGGTAIEGATSSSYALGTVNEVGTNYYYCVITNTIQGYSESVTSAPAEIKVQTVADAVGDSLDGSGTSDDPFLIATAADYQTVADLVAKGVSFSGSYLKQTADIELPATWAGIGALKSGYTSTNSGRYINPFSGTLDGGNYTVTFAYGSLPLFKYVREATVQNLNIKGDYIAEDGLVSDYVVDYGVDGSYWSGEDGGSYAAGCPDTIDITNVTIKSGTTIKGSGFIGGYASGGNVINITGCTVESNVKIGWDASAGASAGQNKIGSFGGDFNGTITNCTSAADVYGAGYVGGIVGSKGQSMGPYKMTNCSFTGTVNATGEMVGGIAGGGYTSSSAPNSPCASIENCYVAAAVTGSSNVGGVFGGEKAVSQCWANGTGYIRNNHFYGTVTATAAGGVVGGVIGYMHSLDRYNIIENNFFVDTCGATKGIGSVNESGVDLTSANYGRDDDPLGEDADKLTKSMTAAEFQDGTVRTLLNVHEASMSNWMQAGSYPVQGGDTVTFTMEISGEYKTEYAVGDELDLTGMEITVTGSDGSTLNPAVEDVEVTGFDSSAVAEELTLTVSYGKASSEITVSITPEKYTVTLPEGEGYTVIGATSVTGGESYSFTVDFAVGYEAGETFAVMVNGEAVTAGEDGSYTVEAVASDLTITVEGVEKIETEPVTVYFSVSHDDEFAVGEEGDVAALKEITVPYFDLAEYGLEAYYFSSETYGDDGDGLPGSDLAPGTAEYAYGKITLMHLYIYATETIYCGLDASEAGQGYLYDKGHLGTDVLTISGSSGSAYLNNFWSYDENLNYYLNYEYPLASEGWGATADQILLEDGDIVTLGHFSSWSFFNDSTSIFNYMVADNDAPKQGDEVTLTLYCAGPNMGSTDGTAQNRITYCPDVYYAPADEVTSGNVTTWEYLGPADENGQIVLDTADLEPGQYIVAMPGQYGVEFPDDIVSTPGGVLLTVEEAEASEVTYGDINGDGEIGAVDAAMVYSIANGKLEATEAQLAAADVNGDGEVGAVDAAMIYSYANSKLAQFPAEAN